MTGESLIDETISAPISFLTHHPRYLNKWPWSRTRTNSDLQVVTSLRLTAMKMRLILMKACLVVIGCVLLPVLSMEIPEKGTAREGQYNYIDTIDNPLINFFGRKIRARQPAPHLFYKAENILDFPYQITEFSNAMGMDILETATEALFYVWNPVEERFPLESDIKPLFQMIIEDHTKWSSKIVTLHFNLADLPASSKDGRLSRKTNPEDCQIFKIVKFPEDSLHIFVLLEILGRYYNVLFVNQDTGLIEASTYLGDSVHLGKVSFFDLVWENSSCYLSVVLKDSMQVFECASMLTRMTFRVVEPTFSMKMQSIYPLQVEHPEIRSSTDLLLPSTAYTLRYSETPVLNDFFYATDCHYYLFHKESGNEIPVPVRADFSPETDQIAYSNYEKRVYILRKKQAAKY